MTAIESATAERMAAEEAAQSAPGTLADAWTDQRPHIRFIDA
jgi:hypothetical protein